MADPTLPAWAKDDQTYQANPLVTAASSDKIESSQPKLSTRRDTDLSDTANDECCCCVIDPILFWFKVFHAMSALIALGALASNLYVFYINDLTLSAFRDATIRLYAAMLCAALICVEVEWRFVIRRIKFLETWILRGLSYAFLGFITVDESGNVLSSAENFTGTLMICLGMLYVVMGVLCIQNIEFRHSGLVKDDPRADYQSV